MAALATALTKNLLALFTLGLGVVLYFLYLALFPTSTPTTLPLDPLSLWSLPPPNSSHPLSGYPLLNQSLVHHSLLFSATSPATPTSPGTYSHHPHIHVVNSSSPLLLVSFSNHLIDEDADGQRVLYLTSPNAGLTWSPSTPLELFPAALNSSQLPSAFDGTKLVRAMCSEGFVQLSGGRTFALAELYGQSQVAGVPREGEGLKETGYGRVAREVNSTDGSLIGGPCWLQRSRFAPALAGTPYDSMVMKDCDDADDLVPLLAQASNQPAWAWSLMSSNHHVHASNDTTDVAEPTHGFTFNSTSTCRFWRLLSPAVNRTLYIECTNATAPDAAYSGWFNGTDLTAKAWYGPYSSIVATNVPDAGSKAYFAAFPVSSGSARSTYLSWHNPANLTHFLLHNPQPRADGTRFPLTLSTSVDNSTFNSTTSLHPSPPPPLRYPGRYKNPGYQYPAAAVRSLAAVNGTTQDMLYVVYSVNKEDVGLSWVRVTDLPRGVTSMAGGGGGGGDSFGKGFVFFVLCVVSLVVVAGCVWTLVWEPAMRVAEEEEGRLGGVGVVKGDSAGGWVEKREPLVGAGTAEEEYYEDGEEEEDEEGEEYDDEDEEEEEVEEKNGTTAPAVVTSADVAHYVAAPRSTAAPASRAVKGVV